MFQFSVRAEIFLFSTLSKLNLGPALPPAIMIMAVLLYGKRNTAVLLIIINLIVFLLYSVNAC
jgi:hypothetical protein